MRKSFVLLMIFVSISILSSELLVTTVPGRVEVYLNGRLIGNTGESGEIKIDLRGGEKLVFRKPGYWPAEVLLDSTDTTCLKIELDLLTQGVITTSPSGADIFIDGLRVGESPYYGYLPSGLHRVKAIKKDFGEIEKTLSFNRFSYNEYHLDLIRYGTVRFESVPKLEVFVDGGYVGLTPATVILDPGTHTVILWNGKEMSIDEIFVPKDYIGKIVLNFKKGFSVRFVSVPSGSWVEVNGEVFRTPFDCILPGGIYKVRIFHPGFEVLEKDLRVSKDYETFSFVLKPLEYEFSLDTDVKVNVFINGKYLGTTPLKTRLREGLKELVLKSKMGTWIHRIYLNEDTKIHLKLSNRGTLIFSDASSTYHVDGVLFMPGDVAHPISGFHRLSIHTGNKTKVVDLNLKAGEILSISSNGISEWR